MKTVRLRFRFQNINLAVISSFVGLEKIRYIYSSIFEIKFNIYLNNDTTNLSFRNTKTIILFSSIGFIGIKTSRKTTLLKSLSEQFTKPILYLDLENLNDYTLLENDPQWFLEQHTDKIVVIDEVQRMLSLFPLLRSLIDQNPEGGRFILLGSASPALLAQSSETLAGRIVYRELTPIRRDKAQASQINLESHWFRGGFPKALLAPDETLWYD